MHLSKFICKFTVLNIHLYYHTNMSIIDIYNSTKAYKDSCIKSFNIVNAFMIVNISNKVL